MSDSTQEASETTQESQETTRQEDMLKLFDEMESTEETQAEPETKDEVEEEAAAPEEVSGETEDVEDEESTETLSAPEHWKDDDKQLFGDLDDKGKEFLLRRHKEMESDYTRKTEEVAGVRKVLEPLRNDFERAGLDETRAMSAIVDFYRQNAQGVALFNKDPVAAIKALAKQHNIPLADGEGLAQQEEPNLDTKFTEFETKINQRFEQHELDRTLKDINDFKNAKDGENLKYPHFEKLQSAIERRVSAGLAEGTTIQEQLKNAYETELWANPELREKLIAEQTAEKEKEAEQKRLKAKQKAAKDAEKATELPKGKTEVVSDKPPKNRRDHLLQNFEKMA
ncbi:MAG: hypothetical protein MJA83_15830 [Gammaproteobacteria bacterium]|nr:hypothetical protein [Gammaproteobacteria bacterium]